MRTVIDLTKSGINDRMPRWPFRMEGIDAAVRLMGRRGTCWIGKTDLSSTSLPALCTRTCRGLSLSKTLASPRVGKAAAHLQRNGWHISGIAFVAQGLIVSAPASRSASGLPPPSRAAFLEK